MDEEEASRIAWKILGEVEELMSDDGVAVSLNEPYGWIKAKAFFPDREYETLEKTIVGILVEATKAPSVVQPQVADGHWKR